MHSTKYKPIFDYKQKRLLIIFLCIIFYAQVVKLLCLNLHLLVFVIAFNNPVTSFCYHLIGLHNDIIWFILIILGVVY